MSSSKIFSLFEILCLHLKTASSHNIGASCSEKYLKLKNSSWCVTAHMVWQLFSNSEKLWMIAQPRPCQPVSCSLTEIAHLPPTTPPTSLVLCHNRWLSQEASGGHAFEEIVSKFGLVNIYLAPRGPSVRPWVSFFRISADSSSI